MEWYWWVIIIGVIIWIIASIFDDQENIEKNISKSSDKHNSEHVSGALGGSHAPSQSNNNACSHSWVRVSHDGGTRLKCSKCHKPDYGSWQPSP